MSKVPYLAYLKNLREAPDKKAAVQAAPSKGLGGQRLAKADLAVYEDGPEEILAQLARDIKMPEETKMKLFENQRSNRALTTDDGTPITLDEANAMMEAEESAPPSGGLMSPVEEDTPPAVDSEDPVLAPFQNTISILKDDTAFMNQLSSMTEKYPGLTEREIFMVAAKESSLLTNPEADNMFEIKSVAADDMNKEGFAIDLKKLNASKNPTDHLKALEKYLDRWSYDGKAPLGLVIAAPGFRNASPDTVVYKAGSAEAKANPGWLDSSGNATVASITEFYRGQ
jgi:hypothetical protein